MKKLINFCSLTLALALLSSCGSGWGDITLGVSTPTASVPETTAEAEQTITTTVVTAPPTIPAITIPGPPTVTTLTPPTSSTGPTTSTAQNTTTVVVTTTVFQPTTIVVTTTHVVQTTVVPTTATTPYQGLVFIAIPDTIIGGQPVNVDARGLPNTTYTLHIFNVTGGYSSFEQPSDASGLIAWRIHSYFVTYPVTKIVITGYGESITHEYV